MHHLQHARREDLESELLAQPAFALLPPAPDSGPVTRLVADDAPRQDLLTRRLAVARELLMRRLHDQLARGPVFSSPSELRDWLRLRLASLEHEVFLVLYLDAAQRLIADEEAFRGTLTQTSVYPRELVKRALALNAAAMVVVHNHPSGQAEPSRADEYLTQTIKSTLALVDVRLIDHFVVGARDVVSFAERGLL